MSATFNVEIFAKYFEASASGGCTAVFVPGRAFPVAVQVSHATATATPPPRHGTSPPRRCHITDTSLTRQPVAVQYLEDVVEMTGYAPRPGANDRWGGGGGGSGGGGGGGGMCHDFQKGKPVR